MGVGETVVGVCDGLPRVGWQVYAAIGSPLLDKAFGGYNATIFAYGQTGERAGGSAHTRMQMCTPGWGASVASATPATPSTP